MIIAKNAGLIESEWQSNIWVESAYAVDTTSIMLPCTSTMSRGKILLG